MIKTTKKTGYKRGGAGQAPEKIVQAKDYTKKRKIRSATGRSEEYYGNLSFNESQKILEDSRKKVKNNINVPFLNVDIIKLNDNYQKGYMHKTFFDAINDGLELDKYPFESLVLFFNIESVYNSQNPKKSFTDKVVDIILALKSKELELGFFTEERKDFEDKNRKSVENKVIKALNNMKKDDLNKWATILSREVKDEDRSSVVNEFFEKDKKKPVNLDKYVKDYLTANRKEEYIDKVLEALQKTDNENDREVLRKVSEHPTKTNIKSELEPLVFKHLVEVIDSSGSNKKTPIKSPMKRINVGYIQVKEDLDWIDVINAGKKIGGKVRKDPKIYKNSDGQGLLLPIEEYKLAFKMFSEDPINRGYVEAIRFQVCEISKNAINLKSAELKKLGEEAVKMLAKQLKGKFVKY